MATLSVNELMQDTMEAFKCSLGPLISSYTTDFSSATAVLNDTITGHIQGVPSTAAYDATTGFANGAAEAETLLTDVPVVLDTLRHVPIKVDYLTQLASKKDLYKVAIAESGYALAKYVLDAVLAKVVAANFSHIITESTANTSYETLEAIRNQANTQKMANMGRFGIVNTAFGGALAIDQRVTSAEYYGQLNGATGYRRWSGVAGFGNIWEYPDLPTTGNLTAFFGDKRSAIIASRLPTPKSGAAELGLPETTKFFPVTDPDTGLSLLGIGWRAQGSLDTYFSVAILFGAAAGKQNGAADAITDKAGIWVRTAA